MPAVNGYDPTSPIDVSTGSQLLRQVAAAARRCSDGRVAQRDDGRWSAIGDPMEAVIDVVARRCELPNHPWRAAAIRSTRTAGGCRSSTAASCRSRAHPDWSCRCAPTAPRAAAAVERFASAGWRTLANAERELQASEVDSDSADDVERDLELVAVLAFEDLAALRRQAAIVGLSARRHTRRHDHRRPPRHGAAIAREVGLAIEGAPVLMGSGAPR